MLQHIIALATGLGIGFIISFPVGPVGFLAIERTLDRGFGAGVRSGVGALFADGLYAGMIAFFARFVRRFFFAYSTVFQVVSIVLLFVIGINMIRTRLSPDVGVETATNKLEEFFSTFFLSLTNPVQFITYSLIFGSVGLARFSVSAKLFFILGIMFGAFIMWLGVAGIISRYRDRINHTIHVYIKTGVGSVLILIALSVMVGHFFFHDPRHFMHFLRS